jgi:hypothetical protein
VYVGKGRNNRVKEHKKANTRLGHMLRMFNMEGIEVQPTITYHANEKTALAMEIFWIAVHGR